MVRGGKEWGKDDKWMNVIFPFAIGLVQWNVRDCPRLLQGFWRLWARNLNKRSHSCKTYVTRYNFGAKITGLGVYMKKLQVIEVRMWFGDPLPLFWASYEFSENFWKLEETVEKVFSRSTYYAKNQRT